LKIGRCPPSNKQAIVRTTTPPGRSGILKNKKKRKEKGRISVEEDRLQPTNIRKENMKCL